MLSLEKPFGQIFFANVGCLVQVEDRIRTSLVFVSQLNHCGHTMHIHACFLFQTATPIPIYDVRASRYVKTYEESLHRIGSGEIKPLYGMNMDLDCKSELDDIPFLISDKWNKQNDPSQPMYGINKPSYYVGFPYSYMPFHWEDGGLDSMNYVFACLSKYAKEWHFIINDDVQATIKKFAGDAEIMSKEGVLDGYRPGCFVPDHHKAFLRTLEYVEETTARSQLVIQQAGDIIYVAPGVPHQVLNLDVNGAVAVSVGSPLWHVCHRLFGTCLCPGNAVKWLCRGTDYYGDVYLRKIRNISTCPGIDCHDTFATKTALNTHILHHYLSQPIVQNNDCSINLTPISGPVENDLSESDYLDFEAVPELFICPKETCSLAYMTRFALKNHIKIHHSEQAAQNSSIMATSLCVDSIPS
ncbi:hypothetical protein QAD02_017806 [Eretmocerus hayati]|uniref:Uncharacterized protein n=1 Tax=Eretmocerus hayati TaxID=131215 RepID=A0ACC2PEM0_9HYME|nr:hypothetical protein QAD02_017806 [Eretmocerus hayati]